MDYGTLIEKRQARLAEIEKLMEDPQFFNDQKSSTQSMREHRGLKKLLSLWEEYQQLITDIEGNEELAKGDDPEFAAMAEEELPPMRQRFEELAQETPTNATVINAAGNASTSAAPPLMWEVIKKWS